MCGICGYLSEKLVPKEILSYMNDKMYHRGPNDAGTWEKQYDGEAVGMAHRRLSILDLSVLGHQPMLSKDGKIIIVFNGEIYNFKELRQELIEKNYSFRSNCDTEVIIAAYQNWGCDCFKKLNGMFAIAIWDEKNKKLILARDRIGKKPLYYYYKANTIVFASELKPIMEFPNFVKEIDKDMIGNFLCNKYIAAPFTIFKNTYKIFPGQYLVYKNGEIKSNKYWNIVEEKNREVNNENSDYLENKKSLEKLLLNSVEARMIADVPIGTFLSGGVDSALITAMAQKVANEPIKTFSIGFHDKERNEAPYAAQIAKQIGTNHHELYVGEKEILAMLEELPFYYDEPFSDSSQLPTMMVSKMASENITVALSGDGGDELFCGYNLYDLTYVAQKVDWIGKFLYHMPGMLQIEKILSPEVRALVHNRDKETKTQLFIDVMIEEADKLLGKNQNNIKYDCEKNLLYKNWQERRMLLDMMTYLPDEILAKTDRASMKYSLEVRCPILDYRVIQYSFKIPHNQKYCHYDKKHILKELTYEYVPKELLDRPKKGFGVPLRKWIRTVLKDKIAFYAEEKILKKQDIFNPQQVLTLIKMQEKSERIVYSSLLWSFYIFQTWYQMYIEDLWNC